MKPLQPPTSLAPLALSQIKVLDLSRVLAGPWACQMLADLGAEVIKVEHPRKGDDTRHWGPPFLQDPQGKETQESAYYLSTNRGKKSVAIDLTTEEGKNLICELVKRSDVLVENFRVGTLQKYGLSYQDLSALNPRLIYCSITGFGQEGPYRDFPGYDYMIQAMGGLMSITGLPEDHDGGGGEPMRVGVPIVDLTTGLYATVAIQAALLAREKTGFGQAIDLSLWDVQVALLSNQGMNYLISGVVPERIGNTHPTIVPYQVFQTADHPLVVAVGNDDQFHSLCQILDLKSVAAEEKFATNRKRVENRKLLVPLLQKKLKEKPRGFWFQLLEQKGIPYAPIHNIEEVFAHPQTVFRKLQLSLPHSLGGQVPSIKNPLHFSHTAVSYQGAPPLLGEHTTKVLRDELGMTEKEISEYRSRGVVN